MSTPQQQQHQSPAYLRYGSLILLVFQNCTSIVLMRYVQQSPGRQLFSIPLVNLLVELVKLVICSLSLVFFEARTNPQYSQILFPTSTTTTTNSFLSSSSSSSSILKSLKENSLHFLQPMKLAVFSKACLQMAIPSGLYTLQNNLLFLALANLDATLFQVSYQLKLIFTVVLMVLMLGREISRTKWMILILLFVGIVLTQLKPKSVKANSGNNSSNNGRNSDEENVAVGMVAVVICSLSSAFASVYFEKVLKGGNNNNNSSSASTITQKNPSSSDGSSSSASNHRRSASNNNEESFKASNNDNENADDRENSNLIVGVAVSAATEQDEAQRIDKEFRAEHAFFLSLSVRNIQLSIFAFIFNFLVWIYKLIMNNNNNNQQSFTSSKGEDSSSSSFFFVKKISVLLAGFDSYVWLLVLVQAAGGLLVAAVIKFADNILKGFATAIAIVANGLLSYFVFDFVPSGLFVLGATIVVLSTLLYSL